MYCVYFVVTADNKYFKVGMSSDIEKRLKSLQGASPELFYWCRYIEFGSKVHASAMEKHLHRLFRDTHVHGEWFRRTSVFIDFIKLEMKEYGEVKKMITALIPNRFLKELK